MAGIPTEHLADQIESLRQRIDTLGGEVRALHKTAVDEIRAADNKFGDAFGEIREFLSEEMRSVRAAFREALEAIMSNIAATKDSVARLDSARAATDATLKSLDDWQRRIFAVGCTATLAILGTAASVIWGASRVNTAVEHHGQRIEKLERHDEEGQAKLQAAYERTTAKLQESIDRLKPAR